jgi:hypothetical protein
MRIRKSGIVFLLIAAVSLFFVPFFQAQEKTSESIKVEEFQEEHLSAGPQDLKEKIGIAVFLAWIWVSILVLVVFLRQKVAEVDRLDRRKFFDSPKGKRFIQ